MRIEMAMRRSQYSFYSTPLTGLPGGRIIEETIKEKLKEREEFSFGYIDIDNFKYFNDNYGYVRGDRAIMQTAYMLYITVSKFGNKKDFLGHIGGDDFVFITTPDRYREICHNVILIFNRIMPFHYSEEDRRHVYVVARDRTHNIKKIPLMSISIAVANNMKLSQFKNVIEINEKVAEVKRYLKTFEGSKFMADRRERESGAPEGAVVYKTKDLKQENYRPLGQILLKGGLVSEEKLDEALVLHWRRGVRLGEVLRELGVVKEKDLASALVEEAGL
ncbi:MAG: diguanylate cyclase [Candidatus Omnitrophica bacterium]|nr:diguanylate cyclase [Candidatus Omnitrophota bacterium]